MWLGQQTAQNIQLSRSGSGSGKVSIDSTQPAVVLDSEKRRLPLALAGCYLWRPEKEQEALVIRDNDGLQYVLGLLGMEEKYDIDLQPGEAALICGKNMIIMRRDKIEILAEQCSMSVMDNAVSIQGKLFLNGIDVEAALRE